MEKMTDEKTIHEKGNLKEIIGPLMEEDFTGSVQFGRGEILLLKGDILLFFYDNRLKRGNIELTDTVSTHKIEKLSNKELRLRGKWYELITDISKETSRDKIMGDLGIPKLDKNYVIKILENEGLLYLLRERDDNASSEG
jgi:hypothetical protein